MSLKKGLKGTFTDIIELIAIDSWKATQFNLDSKLYLELKKKKHHTKTSKQNNVFLTGLASSLKRVTM